MPRWYLNLAIVFLVSGLWHGTSWTYVAWGALHAFFLIFSLATRNVRSTIARAVGFDRSSRLLVALQQCVVFSLVSFAWIFFRANSFSDAIHIVSHLGTGWSHLFEPGWFRGVCHQVGASRGYLLTSIVLIGVLEWIQAQESNRLTANWTHMFAGRHWSLRWVMYTGLLLAIINLGAPRAAPFIYFQF